MKHYGKFIMLAGLCFFAYRRAGGTGLFLFGAAYTLADTIYARALEVIEERTLHADRTEPVGDQGTAGQPWAGM